MVVENMSNEPVNVAVGKMMWYQLEVAENFLQNEV